MKFPSIIKLPRHKEFSFQPRYYDPIREEIQQRTARIRQELKTESHYSVKSNISQSFQRRRATKMSAGLIQLVIILLLMSVFLGYVFFIDWLLYIPLIIIPIYLFLRWRRRF